MNFFCEEPCVVCPPIPEGLDGIFPNPNAEANPFSNFSSEEPDRRLFWRRNYDGDPPRRPPLGPNWRASGCLTFCFSTISQADADACAQRQNILCLCAQYDCDPTPPNPPTDPPQPPFPRQPPLHIFSNGDQSANYICPDGSAFQFTVPEGTFYGFSQAEADATALSVAQAGANNNRVCIGDLANSGMCEGEPYSGTVGFSSPRIGQPGWVLSVFTVSGAPPPGIGLTYTNSDFTLAGTPLSTGAYTFRVRVQVTNGGTTYFMEKNFTLNVIDILQDTLPDAQMGSPYSQTLLADGPTLGDVTWAVTSGTLPAGLTLNSATGAITGTPTEVGVSTFTITMSDER